MSAAAWHDRGALDATPERHKHSTTTRPADDATYGRRTNDRTSRPKVALASGIMDRTRIDLSHTITDGMKTYPGLPEPKIGDHLTRDAAEEVYGKGVRFQIGTITMCSNTGTYMDVPAHRFDDGHDLSALPLERVADVAALCIARLDQPVIDLPKLNELDLEGCAILFRTDHSKKWGTPAYFENHPYLSVATAEALVAANVACVGIDTLNIDATSGEAGAGRPVHTTLLRAGIPIIEHLTNLDALPQYGFRFSAVPPKIVGMGTFTVRAFATVLKDRPNG